MDELLVIAEGLSALSGECCFCFANASMDLRDASRLRLRWTKDDCLSRGEADVEESLIWVIVFVEAVRDIVLPKKYELYQYT